MIKCDKVADLIKNPKDPCDPLVIRPIQDLAELQKAGSASIDLHLGCWFMSLKQARMSVMSLPDATRTQSVQKFTRLHYVPFKKRYILHPHTFVLGSTLEWIRLPSDLGAVVRGKSSWGRRGLIIATATGVHPGFTGCLTLEIRNLGEIPMEIQPGRPICQLFLDRVETDETITEETQFAGYRRPRFGKVQDDWLSEFLCHDEIS